MDSDNHPFSQPSYYLTDYSPHHNSLVPAITGLNSGKRIVRRRKELWVEECPDPFYQQVTIGTLPDDALLEIFHFYVDEVHDDFHYEFEYWDSWHPLVHVCRRWRNVVFGSPRRLDLHLLCNRLRPVKKMLNMWPELPIIVENWSFWDTWNDYDEPTVVQGEDNIVAALELTDRVTRINLDAPSSAMERFAPAMQVPFPALTYLELHGRAAPVISDEFLGGSAPRLETLWLIGILYPALPKLLLSATNLSTLVLHIPHPGYISPEEMVTCLSTLTRLNFLGLLFRSPRSRPSQASPPPRPRAVLPVLTYLSFHGVTEYLEDLVARIDAPLLKNFRITLFNQLVFDILQLPMFLNRTPQFAAFDQANVVLDPTPISITLSSPSGKVDPAKLELKISCRKLEWQLSSLSQVCASTSSFLPHLERLDIREGEHSQPDWQDDMEKSQWLELLRPFTTVKDLHISKEVISRLALALQEPPGQQATEVLPVLQNLYLDGPQPSGPVQKAIGQFVAARQLSGRPVAVHHSEWVKK